MRPINRLRYAKQVVGGLHLNERHGFARRYALHLFPSNAVYTFIPKNGCSTLRFSLAVANGYLDPSSDPHWIHHNINGISPLFKLNDGELATAPHSFVVLRCPYRRMVSAFLDKAVDMKVPAQRLCKTIWPDIDTKEKMVAALSQMTFTTFVESVCSLPREQLDEHFRPQVDFLVLENYTHWFCLENFEAMESRLKSDWQFTLYDTRDRLRHDTHRHTPVEGDFSQATVAHLKPLKNAHKIPAPSHLYKPHTRQLIAEYFDEDIQLYQRHFGSDQTLF